MVVTYPEFGGTETHVLFLAKMLRKNGAKVAIATYGGPFVPYFRSHKIRIHKMKRTGHATSLASNVASLVKKHKYNIVHVHDIESFRMLPHLSKKVPNIPLVMTVHGTYYSKSRLRKATRVASLVIAVSPTVKRLIIESGCSTKKVRWIPNGIDIRRYSPYSNPKSIRRKLSLPEEAKLCLYVGRFQSDKWWIAKKLIMAAESIAKRDNKFMLVLIGYGAYRSHLSRLASQINKRVGRLAIRVLPPTKSIEKYYQAATLVVGTGRVALESMSCGKPVIAAGKAGYDGIIEPGTFKTSVVHQFGDHASRGSIHSSRLSKDISKLLNDFKRTRFLGDFGKSMVRKQFSISRIATLTQNAYAGLLKRVNK